MNGTSYDLEEKVVVVTGGSKGIGLNWPVIFSSRAHGLSSAAGKRRILRPLWKRWVEASGSWPFRLMSLGRRMWRTFSIRPSANSAASISSSTMSE